MTPLVELRGVSVHYGAVAALDDVSLTLASGSYVGVVGPSGAGKTTLLRAVLGLVAPSQGEILVNGRRLRSAGDAVAGYVPQVESVDWNFPVCVEEVVAMGLAGDRRRWPWLDGASRRRIAELLDRLGLKDMARRHIRSLSGGQQQRVFLARALIRRPPMLVLDEPTSGLDVATRATMLDLLDDINASGTAILLTTHDLNGVGARLPHLVCLNGSVVAQGPPGDVFDPDVLRATFSTEMAVVEHEDRLLAVEVPTLDHGHHVHVHHDEHHARHDEHV